jgi:uncharacterized protein YndB with AHSA1/START domain
MKVELASDHPVSDAAVKAATGKTFAQWFAAIDQAVGPDQGRAAVNKFLFNESKVDPWWTATLAVEYEGHHGKLQSDGLPKGYNICVTKTIVASVADAYAAWTTPAALSAWFGKTSEAAVKDGGTFRTADGSRGTFKRVRAGKDLRFTWDEPSQGGPSIVDVVFQDKGKGKTGVMVTHDRIQGRPAADGLRAAWGAALEALKATLEKA